MKLKIIYLMIVFTLIFLGNLSAQDSTNTKTNNSGNKDQEFVDNNNDGYNDNAPDHDGDGIPNALDPDWHKLQKEKKKAKKKKFVDLDGDGINDNIENSGVQSQNQKRNMQGKDGSSMENKNQNGKVQKRQQGKKGK